MVHPNTVIHYIGLDSIADLAREKESKKGMLFSRLNDFVARQSLIKSNDFKHFKAIITETCDV